MSNISNYTSIQELRLMTKKCLVDRLLASYIINFILVALVVLFAIFYIQERKSRIAVQCAYEETLQLDSVKAENPITIE